MIGAEDIPTHRWLFNQLIIALPGACALLRIQATWRWTPDRIRKCVISQSIGGNDRVFLTIFVPDNPAGLAIVIGAALVSGEPPSAIAQRLIKEGPILLLDDPQHPNDQKLLDAYSTICSALQMVREGRATDLSLN